MNFPFADRTPLLLSHVRLDGDGFLSGHPGAMLSIIRTFKRRSGVVGAR